MNGTPLTAHSIVRARGVADVLGYASFPPAPNSTPIPKRLFQMYFHLFRKSNEALSWLTNQSSVFSITPITWMETMVGATNKQAQANLLGLLNDFEMIYLDPIDMDWAMQQMLAYRFSRGVAVMDCFNASVCR